MQAKPDLDPPDAERVSSRDQVTMEETCARSASYSFARRDTVESAANREWEHCVHTLWILTRSIYMLYMYHVPTYNWWISSRRINHVVYYIYALILCLHVNDKLLCLKQLLSLWFHNLRLIYILLLNIHLNFVNFIYFEMIWTFLCEIIPLSEYEIIC